MFNEIGKKIKGVTEAFCILEIIANVLGGGSLLLFGLDDENEIFIALGAIMLIFGTLFIWISHLVIYGFGELVDKVCDIESRKSETPNYSLSALAHEKDASEKDVLNTDGWICGSCGRKNKKSAPYCNGCGRRK